MDSLAESGTVLEICPTSNLHTRAVSRIEDFVTILDNFKRGGVQFTINTDGTYLCGTNLRREFRILIDAGALSLEEAERSRALAFEASFLR